MPECERVGTPQGVPPFVSALGSPRGQPHGTYFADTTIGVSDGMTWIVKSATSGW